jgi:hypothetical protein
MAANMRTTMWGVRGKAKGGEIQGEGKELERLEAKTQYFREVKQDYCCWMSGNKERMWLRATVGESPVLNYIGPCSCYSVQKVNRSDAVKSILVSLSSWEYDEGKQEWKGWIHSIQIIPEHLSFQAFSSSPIPISYPTYLTPLPNFIPNFSKPWKGIS